MTDISVKEEDRIESVAEDIEQHLEQRLDMKAYGHLILGPDIQEENRKLFDGAETEVYVNVTHEYHGEIEENERLFDGIGGINNVSDKADVFVASLPETRTMNRGTTIFSVVL